jgi:hypothetical protein
MKAIGVATCGVMLALLAGCGTEPDDVLGVQGTWSLDFSARSTEACPRGDQAACAGAGSVDFRAQGSSLTTTGSGRGSCDTCSLGLDFTFGAMTSTVEGGRLAMQINACRLTGSLPAETDTTAQGETLCQLPGTPAVVARGTWRMTRVTR